MRQEDFNSRDHWNASRTSQSNKPKSLAEQLKDAAKSPEQKLREMPYSEWCRDLYEYVNSKENRTCSLRVYNYVVARYSNDIKTFHAKGTHFRDILIFANSKQDEIKDR